jgi:hypothetical protein
VERLTVAPDCGMKYLPREIAFAKMQPLADGDREVGAWRRLKNALRAVCSRNTLPVLQHAEIV